MKTLFMAAIAALAAALSASPSLAASDAATSPAHGHYEWRHVPRPGPNKSHLPEFERVWVGPLMAMTSCVAERMTDACKAMPCFAEASRNSGAKG